MKNLRCHAGSLWSLVIVFLSLRVLWAGTHEEEKFAVLQVGTNTYTNATVTSKNPKYILILHSKGMQSLKVASLSPELREQLGYTNEAPKPTLATPKGWVQHQVAKLPLAQATNAERVLRERMPAVPVNLARFQALDRRIMLGVLGGMLIGYLGFCYCCHRICQKAGGKPGVLVWVPFLQAIPLFRAANMSCWWFLALFVPLLNLVAQILWCFKIVRARAKSPVIAVLLLLPVTNIFAFLYLAFSDSAPPKEERVVEIMTLEAA
jgi:hypothetical protein